MGMKRADDSAEINMRDVLEKRISKGEPILLLLPGALDELSEAEIEALAVLKKRWCASV